MCSLVVLVQNIRWEDLFELKSKEIIVLALAIVSVFIRVLSNHNVQTFLLCLV